MTFAYYLAHQISLIWFAWEQYKFAHVVHSVAI